MEIVDYKDGVIDLNTESYFFCVVNQLIKDFKDEEFDSRVSKLKPGQSEELRREVSLFLSAICSRSIIDFSQLMYVVDMPEKILASFLSGGERSWDDFTYQVLKREYIKVLIREKYND